MHEFIPLNHPIMAALSPAGTLPLSLSVIRQTQMTSVHTHAQILTHMENHEDISHGHQGAVVVGRFDAGDKEIGRLLSLGALKINHGL